MINKIIIINSYGDPKELPLRTPEVSGYAITGITGLEPSGTDIKQTQFVSGRRYKYNSTFHKYRQINMSIQYYENNNNRYDIDRLRNDLYMLLKEGDLVKLYFYKDNYATNGKIYYIEGIVDKHQGVTFSQTCGATISITCPDPWFRKMKQIDNPIGNDPFDPSNLTSWHSSTLQLETGSHYIYSNDNIGYEGSIYNHFNTIINYAISYYVGMDIEIKSEGTEANSIILSIPGDHDGIDEILHIDINDNLVDIYGVKNNEKINHIGWLNISVMNDRNSLPRLISNNCKISLIIKDSDPEHQLPQSPLPNIDFENLIGGL